MKCYSKKRVLRSRKIFSAWLLIFIFFFSACSDVNDQPRTSKITITEIAEKTAEPAMAETDDVSVCWYENIPLYEGNVRPTGWHTVKYDVIADRYLYNRCHLIGYQLSGDRETVIERGYSPCQRCNP